MYTNRYSCCIFGCGYSYYYGIEGTAVYLAR